MAEVLNSDGRFWAADKLILAYLAGTGALVAVYWNRLPEAPELLALHVGAAIAIVLASTHDGRAVWYFRHWYPLPLVASCYKEMAILIPAVRGAAADQWLADLDFSIWHANPTVWLERVQTPALTDFLQLVYTLFVPAVLLVPWLLWRKRRFADFRYCAFLISLGFLASYIGYILVPARGPASCSITYSIRLCKEDGWYKRCGRRLIASSQPITIAFRAATASLRSSPGGAAGKSRSGCPGCIWRTRYALFLLQFTFDTITRLT